MNGEEITGSFYEKELQKSSQQKFRIEKVLTRKCDKLYDKWKGMIIVLIVRLLKKTLNEILSMKFFKLNFLNEFYKRNFINVIF